MKKMLTTILNRLFGSDRCSQRAKDDVKKASEVEVIVEKQLEMINALI